MQTTRLSSGLYSSHSPGFSGLLVSDDDGFVADAHVGHAARVGSRPARSNTQIVIDITTITPAVSRLCQSRASGSAG